jgi:hypothetical protein
LAVARHKRCFLPLAEDIVERNNQKAEFIKVIMLAKEMPEEEKLAWMKKTLKGGYNKRSGFESLFPVMLETDFVEGLRLLADLGVVDTHHSNEALLRQAAEQGKTTFCRYLVDECKADLDLAIRSERALGNEPLARKLEELKGDDFIETPSLEAQFKRMRELEQMVCDLTTAVRDIKGEDVKLDKVLRRPLKP